MNQSTPAGTRQWLVMVVGGLLLAGGLLALALPVMLDDYDTWGIQIKCGNGYQSQLLQAATTDENPGRQPASTEGAASHYADQCSSAVAHRRAWALPAVALGVLPFIPKAVAWTRRGAPGAGSYPPGGSWSTGHPDAAMHDAALLDRRERSHHRPPNTTL